MRRITATACRTLWIGLGLLLGLSAMSLWPLPAAAQPPPSEQEQRELQSRLHQKMRRLHEQAQRWQQVQQLLQQFESRMQAGRPQEAEGLLDQALALLEGETPPPARPVSAGVSIPEIQYLVFQVFTYAPNPEGKTQPFNTAEVVNLLDSLLAAVDYHRGDGRHRQLGFAIGPLSLDHTDEELRTAIRASFAVAKEQQIAVAFHIDDSMFWINRRDLWEQPDNVEWVNWDKRIHPHRLIGWAAHGAPILAPPMCYESPVIRAEIARIAKEVIGAEIARGLKELEANGQAHLFAGVIAGWETRLDDDSGTQFGYCSLTHRGFSEQNPPPDFDAELERVVQNWMRQWTKHLHEAGIPKDKIYTHIPVTAGGLHTPLWTTFNEYSRPGFSVYPGTHAQQETLAAIVEELGRHGHPPWANAEGVNVDMRDVARGGGAALLGWDEYLRKQFGAGTALVNIFGWQEPADGPSPFGRATHRAEALAAYKKFLKGELLPAHPASSRLLPP